MTISIIDSNGIQRALGNNPAPVRMGWSVYGDTPSTPMVPRARWPELIAAMDSPGPDHPCLPYVHDQANIGQCNADATAALVEYQRAAQGLPFTKLSPADLYHRINGGGDNGSLLEDALEEMMLGGIGTAATCGLIWQGRSQKQASAEERSRFRCLEAFLCPSFDHCMSAVLEGFGLVSGVMWYDNFNVDRDGWLPARGAGQGGGHAVFGYKPAMRGQSAFGIWHQNSWTEQWGLRGKCVFPETFYRGPVGGWWAMRLAVTEELDVPAPRAAAASPGRPPPSEWDRKRQQPRRESA